MPDKQRGMCQDGQHLQRGIHDFVVLKWPEITCFNKEPSAILEDHGRKSHVYYPERYVDYGLC